MVYLHLVMAIFAEVIATNALKATEGFTRPIPSVIVLCGYAASFYFLSLVLTQMPVGVAYAIWAGLGIVLVTVFAAIAFRQVPDWPAVLGMALIVTGVVVIHVFSKTAAH